MKTKSTTALQIMGIVCLISAFKPEISLAQSDIAAPVKEAMDSLSYADLADLSDASSIVAQATIRNIIALPAEQAMNVPPGHRRLYIEASITALIRGEGGISPTVRYLYDAPFDQRGKLPKLKKARVILFARPGSRPGEIQLIARDGQMIATPTRVERVKAILRGLVTADAPPRITGLGDAFHVAGTVTGESETQIFLKTEKGEPVSLSILRRPGLGAQWAVALGEVVDEAARAPEPGTLLWYRLACSLPAALPSRSVRSLSAQDADAARADYQIVLQSLGPCGRMRSPA